MIEINLLPGTRKRRRPQSFLPSKRPELPDFNWLTAFVVAAWVIGPVIGLWLYFGVRSDLRETEAELEQAVADSARYASVIETQATLRARQDTIAQKLAMIQEIDAGRYVWPHIMDEVSRALPPFTWLDALDALNDDKKPEFQIQGRTGSLPALTRYMDALEASPFLRNIQLVSSEQDPDADVEDAVSSFILTGAYEAPSLDVLETVPLFGDAQAGEGSNGAAGTS
jgi:Tfp pilus assembly protein PilN